MSQYANAYETTNNTAEPTPYCQGISCTGCDFLVIICDYFGNSVGYRCTKK